MWGDTLEGGDTRVKAIKSDSDNYSDEQKRSPGFSGKNGGVTPSVTAPGVTHPSDATGFGVSLRLRRPLQMSQLTQSLIYLLIYSVVTVQFFMKIWLYVIVL